MKLLFLTIAAVFGIISCNKAQEPEMILRKKATSFTAAIFPS
jgi:hypothetical protein